MLTRARFIKFLHLALFPPANIDEYTKLGKNSISKYTEGKEFMV